MRPLLLACAVVAASLTTPALAAPSWDELTPRQQAALEDLAETWDQLPDDRRDRLLQNFQRWQEMSPDERRKAKAAHKQVKDLSPEQRQALRDCLREKRNGRAIDCRKVIEP